MPTPSNSPRIEVLKVLEVGQRRRAAALVRVILGPLAMRCEVVRRHYGVLALRLPNGAGGAQAVRLTPSLERKIIETAAPHLARGKPARPAPKRAQDAAKS